MQWRVNSLSSFNTRLHTLQTLSVLWGFLFDSLLWSCSSASHNMLRNQGVNRKNSIADILPSPGGNSRALAIYSTSAIIWLMVEMSERRQRSIQFTDAGPLLWREWIFMTGWKRLLRHECVMLTLQLPFSCLSLFVCRLLSHSELQTGSPYLWWAQETLIIMQDVGPVWLETVFVFAVICFATTEHILQDMQNSNSVL